MTALTLAVPASAGVAKHTDGDRALAQRAERQQRVIRQDRQVLRFFGTNRWLLRDRRFAKEAKRQVAQHRAHLALTVRRLTATRVALAKRQAARELALARARSPQAVICRVFGGYCAQALAVARCESGLSTGARNGEYRGLFQMGSSERRLYGHGAGAAAQARAAHSYFVRSGRDWSPWSCKPW